MSVSWIVDWFSTSFEGILERGRPLVGGSVFKSGAVWERLGAECLFEVAFPWMRV